MNKQFSQDTYFYNVIDAIKESKEDNDVYLGHPTIFGKQICYYNADKKVDELPENCIFVPLENFYNYFSNTKNRLPKRLVIYKDDLEENEILLDAIEATIKMIKNERKQLEDVYIKEIKNLDPDFNDKKLRVLLPTSIVTTVMQYVIKGIYDILKEYNNLEVKLSIEETLFEDVNDNLSLLVDIYNFNPHIIISINHVFQFINEKVFNFVWFQDTMPFLKNKEIYKKRQREFFFSLTKHQDKMLEAKQIPFQRQNFAVNDKLFKINKEIKREDKIVFIGSSYNSFVDNSFVTKKIIDELETRYELGEDFSNEYMEDFSKKFNIPNEYLEVKLIPYVIRDFALRWLCKSNLIKKFKIEIYGWGWDIYPETKQYFKGELKHGQEIADVYSSAKFTLAPHSAYIIQQRVLEAIFCGCQPVLYDCRNMDVGPYYEDVFLYYKSKEDLLNSFVTTKENNFEDFKKEFTYKDFAEKILNIVEKNKNE